MKFELINEVELFSLDKTLGTATQNEPIYKQLKIKGEYLNLIYTRELGWMPLKGFRSITKALDYAKTNILKEEKMTQDIEDIYDKNKIAIFEKMNIEQEQKEKLNEAFKKAVVKKTTEIISKINQQNTEKDTNCTDLREEKPIETELYLNTDTSLLEAIKESDISNMSFFAKSRLLDTIEEKLGLNVNEIEEYISNQNTTINENVALENTAYNKITEAIKVIQPIQKPDIKMSMTESQIWAEIKNNEDWLLESKLKNYLTAKSNEYQKKEVINKIISKEVHQDPIFEMNKLEKTILSETKNFTQAEKEKINIILEEGVERYKILKETLDINPPRDNSLLSRHIRYASLSEREEVKELFEKTEAYLQEQIGTSNKALEKQSFFDYKSIIEFNGTDTNLQFLGKYKIILKENKDNFFFNIISEAFMLPNTPLEQLPKQLEEEYITDLLKAKKTLERQFKGKKFSATADTSDTNSIKHLDTNGWRIHLYQDPSKEKNIDFNIEYYPSGYKKSDLTETETFFDTIKESKTAKQLEKYLLSGEHIFIKDTGVVLWYSTSDKTFMIDMKPVKWNELYKLYKAEDKRGSTQLSENTNTTTSTTQKEK